MSEKKIVDVTTEHVDGRGDLLDDAMSLFTFGAIPASTSDHYSTTVTYDDGTVSNGTGSTKETAIKNAVS